MGNFASSDGFFEYKGKKYEPSQHQVNLAYSILEKGIDDIADHCLNRWGGVDEELLWKILRSKLRKRRPRFASFLSTTFLQEEEEEEEGGGGGDNADTSSIVPSTICVKRRKIDFGPIIIHNIRVPVEVIAHVAPYCDRASINSLSLTSRGIHNVIHDRVRGMVETIPWPTKCPWREGYKYIVVSRGFHHVAVAYEMYHGGVHLVNIEIWDRWHGLIGELDWHKPEYDYGVKPIFSPDGQLLLAPLVKKEEGNWNVTGVQTVQLPLRNEKRPITVSEHHITHYEVTSLAFVNNDNIVVEDDKNIGFGLWTVSRVNGCINLGFSRLILEHQLTDSVIDHSPRIASCILETKNFLAFRGHNFIIFYDVSSNQSLMKSLPGEGKVTDLAFALDGKLAVTFRRKDNENSGDVCVFDCNVSTIREIGHPRVICSSDIHGSYENIAYFSADGTKVAMQLDKGGYKYYNIIDLQKGGVVRGVRAWDHPAWIDFIN